MSEFSVLKQIKTKPMIYRIVIALVVLIVAAGATMLRVPSEVKYFTATKNVFEEPCDKYKEDQFFRGHLYFLYNWFAENDDARFYLAPVRDSADELHYLIVYIPKKYEPICRDIILQTEKYEESGDDSELFFDINCRGYMADISPETYKYLDQYLTWINAPYSVRENLCTQMFVMVPTYKAVSERLVFYVLLDIGAIITAICLLISALTGRFLKPLKKKLKSENMTLQDLEDEFATPLARFDTTIVSEKHVFDLAGNHQMMRISDVVWIYPGSTYSVNGVSLFRAIFMTRYHLCNQFTVRTSSNAENLCKWVQRLQPNAMYGYLRENSEMYYKHFNELIARVYNQGGENVPLNREPDIPEQPAPAQVPTPAPVAAENTETPSQETGTSAFPVLTADTINGSKKNELDDYVDDIFKPGN